MAGERRPNGNVLPAIVFIHGFALDARMWQRQVDTFAPDFRILTVDLPGFGPQARELGTVDPAAEVGRAMDISGLVRAHVVASSYGAAVAVDFALRNARRVQSLTLMGPFLLGRRMAVDAWTRCVAVANEGDRPTAAEMWLEDTLFDSIRNDEELYEELRLITLDYGGAHWTGQVVSQWSDPDPAERLKEIDIPALVLSGEGDGPGFLQMAEAYARGLPRARREIVKGAGHLPNIERPVEFNELLRNFLRSTSVSTAPRG